MLNQCWLILATQLAQKKRERGGMIMVKLHALGANNIVSNRSSSLF